MFSLERRFINRWQARLSYVYSKTAGNVTSGTFTGVNSSLFENPNTSLINREGRVPLDRPHEVKVFAGYQIPKIEVAFNGYFRRISGQTYTPFFRVPAGRVNWTGSVDVNLARFPSASIAGDTVNFGGVTAVTPARQITFGVRWSF
jgi:hypothetical protein